MAKIDYPECGFRYFWRDVSLQSLRDYARRLDDLFKQSHPDGFSSDEFLNTFTNHLEHYDPHSGIAYEFDFDGTGAAETWEIKIRVTQIPNVEGGVVRAAPQVQNRLGFGYSLIEHGVAHTVEISQMVQAKGFRRLLGKDISGTLIGKPVHLYLRKKLFRVRSLNFKMRWEPSHANNFEFDAFADRVADALGSTHAEVIKLDYGPQTDDAASFMKQCDERLKSNVDRDELERLFSLIELSPTEWFAS
jgi:hypothetical protein